MVNLGAKAIETETQNEKVEKPAADAETGEAANEDKKNTINFSFGGGPRIKVGDNENMASRLKIAIQESLIQVLWLPVQIFVFSFSAIIVALLYLKTRLAGGESMNDLIERFENEDRPRKKWQERVRQRLMQSGRLPSKP